MEKLQATLKNIGMDDLYTWAGGTILTRGKSYVKKVGRVFRTPDGALAAWVAGGENYATLVSVNVGKEQKLSCLCTCPYAYGPCKHAVALVLAAAEQIRQKQPIPLLDEQCELYMAIFCETENNDLWDDDLDDHDEDEYGTSPRQHRKKTAKSIKAILEGKSRAELLNMLLDLAESNPDLARRIRDVEEIKSGNVKHAVDSLQKQIRSITRQPAWSDYWSEERDLPDYAPIREQLAALLAGGHAEAVLQLGEELWSLAQEQVEQSDDDGETGIEISYCLDVVLDALPRTSLTPSQQILWMIDHILDDDYSLLESCSSRLDNQNYNTSHWHEAAHSLEARLKKMRGSASGNHNNSYQYRRFLHWLFTAYEHSGEQARILPLMEQEVDATRDYEELVDVLLAAGENERARQWCIDGFTRTAGQYAGIADALQRRLREMAEKEQRFDLAAAYRAQDFFEDPNQTTYMELRKAAERIQLWPVLRAAALAYLQTGHRPDLDSTDGNTAAWPLPVPEVRSSPRTGMPTRYTYPYLQVLIDIAILEKRFDDVLQLYQALQKTSRFASAELERKVAKAVAKTHPRAALDIWLAIVQRLIGKVKPSAYEEAAIYLELMRGVYADTHRLEEWRALITRLRVEHKPKRRLLAVLDILEKKRLIDP